MIAPLTHAPIELRRRRAARAGMLAATVLLAAAMPLGAAVGQTVWTIDRVLAGPRNDAGVLSRLAEEAAARADVNTAKWQRFPAATLEAAAHDAGNQTGVLRIDQPLWTGGRLTAAIDGATSRLSATAAATEELRLDVTMRAIAAFAEALKQSANLDIAAAGLTEHEALAQTVQRRVTEGLASAPDLRLVEARVLQASNEVALATQSRASALIRLGTFAGEPVERVSGAGADRFLPPSDSSRAVEQALAFSPTVRRLTFEVAAAASDVATQRAAVAPQVGLRAEKAVGAVRDNRLMLQFQVQTGPGFAAKSGVEAALARQNAARFALESARRDVEERTALDWAEWDAAKKRLRGAQDMRERYADVVESFKRQYDVGRRAPIDLLNAVRELTVTDFAIEEARATMLAAALRLFAETGGVVERTTLADLPRVANVEPAAVPAEPTAALQGAPILVARLPEIEVPTPAAAELVRPVVAAAQQGSHVVLRGETAYGIARRYGTDVAAVVRLNPDVDLARLQVGQALVVPASPGRPPAASGASAPAADRTLYVVRRGETAFGIAKAHGMSLAELSAMNPGLALERLAVGQELRVR